MYVGNGKARAGIEKKDLRVSMKRGLKLLSCMDEYKNGVRVKGFSHKISYIFRQLKSYIFVFALTLLKKFFIALLL